MSALYAKLRSIHKSYGKHGTRYTSSPSYSEEVEILPPFALAIQEFGAFETHSLENQSIYSPTFPEGNQNEGREKAEYPLTEYLSFLPTIKSLAIPCKSIDSKLTAGSAWWTYIVRNVHHTSDLVCTLPPLHYSYQTAVLRSVYMAPTSIDDPTVANIVKVPKD